MSDRDGYPTGTRIALFSHFTPGVADSAANDFMEDIEANGGTALDYRWEVTLTSGNNVLYTIGIVYHQRPARAWEEERHEQ